MNCSDINDGSRVRRLIVATVFYATFAAMFFMKVNIPFMMVFPMATLVLSGIGMIPWQMCLAALFSAAGDAMGVQHRFIPQMAFFMLAHIMMISWYVPLMRRQGKLYTLSATLLVTALVAFAFIFILSHVEDTVINIGTSLYCIVISAMFLCSMMQVVEGNLWSRVLPVGAFLFLASDMVLAWNKFVCDIPGERYFIMVPYYIGQLLIFWGAAMSGKRNDRIFSKKV